MNIKNIFITGINGFIGSNLNKYLVNQGYNVAGSVRKSENKLFVETGQLDNFDDWYECIGNSDIIIHCAARVHQKNISIRDEQKCIAVNRDATIKLAKAAKKRKVKKFIFISTIGVNGTSSKDNSFSANSPHDPQNSYSKSKSLAEAELIDLCKNGPMELFILRLPLVYGGDAPGNVSRLRNLIATGIPIPFKGIKNLKSFLHIDNLNSYIHSCFLTNTSKHLILFPSDKEDLSTSDFIRLLAKLDEKKLKLFWFFPMLINFILNLMFQNKLANSLFENLLVSDHIDGQQINFQPAFNPKKHIRERS